ncbi:MAG: Glycerol-3-phosphate dehydrogenase [NAD(P)+] [Chlamydiia bacterium]|nr:Glycerol-3-phosphate dehydrogenase [NAD(P)+] [Chlamydiia bacterium]
MKITCLGSGAWGFTLASLLAGNGHDTVLWSRNKAVVETLEKQKEHPKFPGIRMEPSLKVTTDFKSAIEHGEIVLESVTTGGIRETLKLILDMDPNFSKPLVLSSKGIEQKTGLLVDEIVMDVMGEKFKEKIGCISGPCIAKEVMQKLPTSCVCSGYDSALVEELMQVFTNPYFRVYPNSDMAGVEFGGAMKNIIAIACGMSDGLGYGANTKSAIMTRGLHEIRKLSVVKGCNPETLNGLAGLGDLCTTCLSPLSRNYRFGFLIAEGVSPENAKKKIGMVVEGVNTCLSALELGKKANISLPITQAIVDIVYNELAPLDAVRGLLTREIKKEHL